MPSNFLSKFSRSTTVSTPDGQSRSPSIRGRTISTTEPRTVNLNTSTQASPTPTPRLVLTSDGNDSPVPPPSPGSIHRADSPATAQPQQQQQSAARGGRSTPQSIPTPRSATIGIEMPHTTSPTEASSATHGLGIDLGPPADANDDPGKALRHKSSERSVRSQTTPQLRLDDIPPPRTAEIEQTHERRGSIASSGSAPIIGHMQPIVESPDAQRTSFNFQPIDGLDRNSSTTSTSLSTNTSSHLLSTPAPSTQDSDAISIRSTGATKKAPWRRASSAKDKPKDPPPRKLTGLASAIAASGMAMANPTVNMQPPPQLSSPPRPKPKTQRTASSGSGPNRTRSRHETASGGHVHHHHTASNGSPNGDDNGNDEYSDMSSGSESELDLDDDIPVTGFAVASSKRNADFHELFPSVPEGDYLIEDYGCALQREILIQGRIYISENHICFHANIFGWITDLTIPVYEITGLEKKMTAFVIPNAIQICTRATKYTFASFLSRDTTFDVMHNIWRLARPDASAEGDTNSMLSRSPRGSLDSGRGTPARSAMDVAVNGNLNNGMALDLGGGGSIESGGGGVVTGKRRKATLCACGRNKQHYSETPMEVILPGSPEKIYNLMFASGFIKDFMREDQKLMDVQISDWYREGESGLLSRNFSYIKPLGGGLGPKQTKCELKDETVHCDFDDYVSTVTTTRTPDVPSGSVFAVKTRTCIMWASAATTRVVVTSQVEWSGRSFIKSIIEKSALDGQKTYHADLERAMRSYINEHRTEFIPDGVDVADAEPLAEAIVESPLPVTPGTAVPLTPGSADAEKQREHERNQRGLQWAWDTLMGAWKVAKQSTTGALDLISDAWDQSSSTTILIFVIVVLVLSNLWTLMMVGKREEIGRRKELRKVAERERWVQGVVAALWEEMAAGRGPHPQVQSDGALIPKVSSDWRDEVGEINLALDAVEERVKRIRKGLQELD